MVRHFQRNHYCDRDVIKCNLADTYQCLEELPASILEFFSTLKLKVTSSFCLATYPIIIINRTYENQNLLYTVPLIRQASVVRINSIFLLASGYCICVNINLVVVRTDIELIRLKNQDKYLVSQMMQHCAGFISAGSLYMFRAQAPKTCRVTLQK